MVSPQSGARAGPKIKEKLSKLNMKLPRNNIDLSQKQTNKQTNKHTHTHTQQTIMFLRGERPFTIAF